MFKKEDNNNSNNLKNTTHEEYENYKKIFIDSLNKQTEKYLEKNKEILKKLRERNLNIPQLNKLMKKYIECQLNILIEPFDYLYYDEDNKRYESFKISRNIGLYSEFHEIRNPKTKNLKYPIDCFTVYLSSDDFKNEVSTKKEVIVDIPEEFIEFLAKF